MPTPPEHAFKEKSTKLLILPSLRTIYNRTFQCETPCSSKFIQKFAQMCQYFTLIDQSIPLDNFYITFYLRTNQRWIKLDQVLIFEILHGPGKCNLVFVHCIGIRDYRLAWQCTLMHFHQLLSGSDFLWTTFYLQKQLHLEIFFLKTFYVLLRF